MKNVLGSKSLLTKKTPARLFVNNEPKAEIDLEPYAKDAETRALQCAEKIMAQSYTVADVEANDVIIEEFKGLTFKYDYITVEKMTASWRSSATTIEYRGIEGAVDEPAYPPPEEPFIAYTTAHILTGNATENGFEGTIFATAYGYCFPHIKPRYNKYNETYDVDAYKIYEWKCVPFGVSCIYRVKNNNAEIVPVAFRSFGGIDSDVSIFPENNCYLARILGGIDSPNNLIVDMRSTRHLTLLANSPNKDFDELLPVENGFYRLDKFGRLTFFDSRKNKVAENIPVHENFYHVEIQHGEFLADTYNLYFNDPPILKYKVYTSDGNVKNEGMFLNERRYKIILKYNQDGNLTSAEVVENVDQTVDENLPPVDGYYIKYSNGILEPLHFTPLFYEFKNGSYLYGVKGGKLYFKQKTGEVEEVGDGLKNFRLRKLKKISMAKK